MTVHPTWLHPKWFSFYMTPVFLSACRTSFSSAIMQCWADGRYAVHPMCFSSYMTQVFLSACRTSFSSATVQHWNTWDLSTTMQTERQAPLDEGLGGLWATPGDFLNFQWTRTTAPTPFFSPLWVWLARAGG